jgi:hypothetical protein
MTMNDIGMANSSYVALVSGGNRSILANSAGPGRLRTDTGGPTGARSVEQSGDTIVWLPTLSAEGPTGGSFADRKLIEC